MYIDLVYSLIGEKFLFKRVKVSLTTLRQNKSLQLLNKPKHIFLVLSTKMFTLDQIIDDSK